MEHRLGVKGYMVVGRADPERSIITSAEDYPVARKPQCALESHSQHYGAAAVTVPGFEQYNHHSLSPADANRFNHNANAGRGVTQVLETSPGSAVLEERSRMAREIHDTLAQEFAGILLHLEAVGGAKDSESSIISECLARARELAKCGLEDVRRMLLALRPKSLEGTNLVHALRQLAGHFSRDCGISCTFREEGRAREIPPEIQDELYRVAQEALCNVRKHSCAPSASISLRYETGLVVLKIKDTGKGFGTAADHAFRHGYGLSTMRERAQRLGGKIEIETGPGAGARVEITVPFPGDPRIERSNQ